MAAVRAGDAVVRSVHRASLSELDRPAVLVVAGGPIHIDEVLRRDELPIGSIDHEEETILWRVEDHLAHATANREVGEDHGLRRRVVPVVARILLIVPD